MRILVAIPHYFRAADGIAADGRWHASLAEAPPRIAALTACLSALHQLFGTAQRIIDQHDRHARPANQSLRATIEIVVCTTAGDHLIDRLPLPAGTFLHHPTNARPELLGFACHQVLAERLGSFDFYVYLEDDLICRDPWMFQKLRWFNSHVGDEALLQPNRYEVNSPGFVSRAYVDGSLDPSFTHAFQDITTAPVLHASVLGTPLRFVRPTNPHAGCFFLNAAQMAAWTARPDFLDRDLSFVGPLESAATLGIMRAFRIYKPAPECASFLEIEHHGNAFISQLRPA